MSTLPVKTLRLLFWASWAGMVMTWTVVLFGRFFDRQLNAIGSDVLILSSFTLCFTSILCISRAPRLALLGFAIFVAPYLLPWLLLPFSHPVTLSPSIPFKQGQGF